MGGDSHTAAGDRTTGRHDHRRLMDEMLEGIALSMLIFLIADIRLMSATGRIATKFETIAVDSDLLLRDKSSTLAGTSRDGEVGAPVTPKGQRPETGLSPAQIMAVVLVELKKTMDIQEARALGSAAKSVSEHLSQADPEPLEDVFSTFAADPTSNSNDSNETMHALLEAYAQMVRGAVSPTLVRLLGNSLLSYVLNRLLAISNKRYRIFKLDERCCI